MADPTYYLVRHSDGDPMILMRKGPGIERYDGDGRWVPDGHLIRYWGLGGDADDIESVADGDLADIMADLDVGIAADAAARANGTRVW